MGAIRAQYFAWTPEKEAQLLKLWRVDGLTMSQCAERFGVKRGAISGKLHRLGALTRGENSNASTVNTSARMPKTWRTGNRRLTFGRPSRSRARRAKMELRVHDLGCGRFEDIAITASDPLPHERVQLVNLTHDMCRWPMGDPLKDDFAYCGRKRNGHKSYCDHHAERSIRARGEEADRIVDEFVEKREERITAYYKKAGLL